MSDTIENTAGETPTVEATQPVEAAAVEVPSYRQRQTIGQLFRTDLGFIPVLITLIVIVVFFQVISGGLFLSSVNITNLFLQTATYGLLGLGIVLVLLLGEIDLSIAAVATFSSVIMADLSERAHYPAFVAIVAALACGALIGAFNGFFVAVLRIPSFIVTLATNIAFSGLVITFLFGQATLEIANSFIDSIAGSFVSYLPDVLGVGSLVPVPSVEGDSPFAPDEPPAARLAPVDGLGVRCSERPAGTATATAAATAAADATETAALRNLRRRARLVISSKVPGGGGSGRTCWFSQRSSGSCSCF